MSSNVLSPKDVNTPVAQQDAAANTKSDVKSMEYHREVFQKKMAAGKDEKNYVSPSDTIMSPCTAKLSAFRNKQVGKAKPKSLFAQASAKKFEGENLFGAKNVSRASGF